MGSTGGPLAIELATNAAKFRTTMPDAIKTLEADSAALAARYKLKPLTVGDTAPNFTLPNATKKSVSLSTLLKENKAVVLTMYRGAWCPYCNIALNHLSKMVPQLEKLGGKLVALTPETPDEAMTLKEKSELKFEVLSDDGCEVALKYGAAFKVSDVMKGVIKGMGVEFDKINGNSETRKASLPVPATFVIGKDGKITYSFFKLDYTKRAEPADILAAVKKIAA